MPKPEDLDSPLFQGTGGYLKVAKLSNHIQHRLQVEQLPALLSYPASPHRNFTKPCTSSVAHVGPLTELNSSLYMTSSEFYHDHL